MNPIGIKTKVSGEGSESRLITAIVWSGDDQFPIRSVDPGPGLEQQVDALFGMDARKEKHFPFRFRCRDGFGIERFWRDGLDSERDFSDRLPEAEFAKLRGFRR